MEESQGNPGLDTYLVSKEEAYERGRVDFNFFAGLVAPDVMVSKFPPMYLAMWFLITHRKPEDAHKILRFALGLPRGFAKTTFVKIVLCWLIVYDKITHVLVVAASEDLAVNILFDVVEMLCTENATAVYGNFDEIKVRDQARSVARRYHKRLVIITARGALSTVRGINLNNTRPDFILLDDVQTRENDQSPSERERLLGWVVMTLFKCLSFTGNRTIAYLGNMYSDECLLYKFQSMPEWYSLITGAIIEGNKSIWPELQTVEEIIDSFFHDESLGLGDSWMAEIMNDPSSINKRLLPGDAPLEEELQDYEEVQGGFVTIDPAGMKGSMKLSKKEPDNNCIVSHLLVDDKPCIAEIDAGHYDPQEVIFSAVNQCLSHRISTIFVESVAYQSTLIFWFNKILKKLNLLDTITVLPISPHGREKETRIKEFCAEYVAGRYRFLNANDRNLFIWYARKYKIGATNNSDDVLDGCAYGVQVEREYGEEIRRLITVSSDDTYQKELDNLISQSYDFNCPI